MRLRRLWAGVLGGTLLGASAVPVPAQIAGLNSRDEVSPGSTVGGYVIARLAVRGSFERGHAHWPPVMACNYEGISGNYGAYRVRSDPGYSHTLRGSIPLYAIVQVDPD